MVVTGAQFKSYFLGGAHALNDNKDYINELNVFPVPDGDTGTNMTMTIISASKELLENEGSSLKHLCRAISSGALKGARGNSGVILSQLLRGFLKTLLLDRDWDEILLVEAMEHAVDSAYKAVMKPKEGTILTVAKGMSVFARQELEAGRLENLWDNILEKGDEVLAQTPEMLPVLKEAGVVDSGGQGLMTFLHGVLDAVHGKEVPMTLPVMNSNESADNLDVSSIETADIKFGYCTEFIIKLEKDFSEKDEKEFKEFLTSIGDSIVCIHDENIVKVHVHSNDPGLAIQKGLSFGQLSRMKIDNMREEHEERIIHNASEKAKREEENVEPTKEIGFIEVSAGEGFKNLFESMNVDFIISGGQTMNPSTEDFLAAIRKVPAKNIFIFPNNGNIYLSAKQAADLSTRKNVIVVPTRSVVDGLSCMMYYDNNSSVEENLEAMKETMENVQDVEITYAVRDTEISGTKIEKDDFMALCGKDILASGKNQEDVILTALKSKVTEETAVITLYYGDSVTLEEGKAFSEKVEELFPDVEVELLYGGQPVYYYFIGIE